MGNHDQPRIASRYGVGRVDGMLTLLLTLPGVPVTYNGDEIGMLDNRDIPWEDTLDPQACNLNPDDFVSASRDAQRTPFQWDLSDYSGFTDATIAAPWLPVNPNYPSLNLELQMEAAKSIYKYYNQLVEFRQNEVFERGSFESHAFSDEVFGYRRTLGDVTFVVLINFSETEQIVDINDLGVGFPIHSHVVVAGSTTSYEAE